MLEEVSGTIRKGLNIIKINFFLSPLPTSFVIDPLSPSLTDRSARPTAPISLTLPHLPRPTSYTSLSLPTPTPHLLLPLTIKFVRSTNRHTLIIILMSLLFFHYHTRPSANLFYVTIYFVRK